MIEELTNTIRDTILVMIGIFIGFFIIQLIKELAKTQDKLHGEKDERHNRSKRLTTK